MEPIFRKEQFIRFLAACAAGGALAPKIALTIAREIPNEEVKPRDVERVFIAGNMASLAMAPYDFCGLPALFVDGSGDIIETPAEDEVSVIGYHYVSSYGTSVIPADNDLGCFIQDRDGNEIEDDNYYRYTAAAVERAIPRKPEMLGCQPSKEF